MLKIGFHKLKIPCIIGVYPDERKYKQNIFIDLEVKIKEVKKIKDLSDSYNYEGLKRLCIDIVNAKKYFLIEVLAQDIVDALLEEERVLGVNIVIKKPNAIESVEDCYVNIVREK